jgi:hypothetical protein
MISIKGGTLHLCFIGFFVDPMGRKRDFVETGLDQETDAGRRCSPEPRLPLFLNCIGYEVNRSSMLRSKAVDRLCWQPVKSDIRGAES